MSSKKLILFSFVFWWIYGLSVQAQNLDDVKISVSIENMSFEEALQMIEDDYGLKFSYDSRLIPTKKIFFF